MLTMSRLPSDSFLPTGGMHFSPTPNDRSFSHVFSTASTSTTSSAQINGRSTSGISPLSLPHALDQISYLDELAVLPHSNHHRSQRRGQSSTRDQQRQASLSPTKQLATSDSTSPSIHPLSSPSQSVSPERSSVPALTHQLKRVVLQNRRLLENWEAERTHLEANRARAEEVYKEEREIMDEERVIWQEEKAQIENELLEWKRRAEVAESERDNARKEVDALRKQCDIYRRLASSSPSGRASGSSAGTPVATGSGSSSSAGDRLTSVQFKDPISGLSPLTGPPFSGHGRGTTMPESKPFEPLDPRMQSASSTTSPQSVEQDRIPSINISEVIPGLEGIRVKRPALERSTFTDDTVSSSSSKSDSSSSKSRSNPAQMTKQALEAPETSRLTLHAGHTPNHSISLSRLQTVESTRAANTADSSGAATPTQELVEPALGSEQPALEDAGVLPAPVLEDTEQDEEPMGYMDPSEGDRPLEGPLQLRNRPASDEPFLRRLSDKLEDFIRSNDTTPTVLRATGVVSPPAQSPPQQAADAGIGGGGDVVEAAPAGLPDNDDGVIPLKRKQLPNLFTHCSH